MISRLVLAFFGVFLMGLIAGWQVTTFYEAPSKGDRFIQRTANPKEMSAVILKVLIRKFQLSADEQTRIGPVLLEMSQSLYQDRIQFGLQALADEDKYHAKLAALMEPAHQAIYEQAYKDYRAKLAAELILPSATPTPSP